MSFSGMVKEELSKQLSLSRHCMIAELTAFLSAGGRMTTAEDGGKALCMLTENEAVARKCFTILEKTCLLYTSLEAYMGVRYDNILIQLQIQRLIQKNTSFPEKLRISFRA